MIQAQKRPRSVRPDRRAAATLRRSGSAPPPLAGGSTLSDTSRGAHPAITVSSPRHRVPASRPAYRPLISATRLRRRPPTPPPPWRRRCGSGVRRGTCCASRLPIVDRRFAKPIGRAPAAIGPSMRPPGRSPNPALSGHGYVPATLTARHSRVHAARAAVRLARVAELKLAERLLGPPTAVGGPNSLQAVSKGPQDAPAGAPDVSGPRGRAAPRGMHPGEAPVHACARGRSRPRTRGVAGEGGDAVGRGRSVGPRAPARARLLRDRRWGSPSCALARTDQPELQCLSTVTTSSDRRPSHATTAPYAQRIGGLVEAQQRRRSAAGGR
eukprot:366499-Chlamydomonas_euryale.AAC.5